MEVRPWQQEEYDMKISDIKDTSTQMIQQYQRNDTLPSNQPIDKQTSVPAAPAERVEISKMAKDIQKAKNAIAGLPDIREEKVEELKSQIENGTYAVNSDKLAGKIVGDSLLHIIA